MACTTTPAHTLIIRFSSSPIQIRSASLPNHHPSLSIGLLFSSAFPLKARNRSSSGGGESRCDSSVSCPGLESEISSTPSSRAKQEDRAFGVVNESRRRKMRGSVGDDRSCRRSGDVAEDQLGSHWIGRDSLPIRMSSSRRSGFGSSLLSGSVNTLASGSGGHEISVKGLRGRSSSTLAAFVPSALEVVEGSSAESSKGAGASLATVFTAEQSLSIQSTFAHSYSRLGLTLMPFVACDRTAIYQSRSLMQRRDLLSNRTS